MDLVSPAEDHANTWACLAARASMCCVFAGPFRVDPFDVIQLGGICVENLLHHLRSVYSPSITMPLFKNTSIHVTCHCIPSRWYSVKPVLSVCQIL